MRSVPDNEEQSLLQDQTDVPAMTTNRRKYWMLFVIPVAVILFAGPEGCMNGKSKTDKLEATDGDPDTISRASVRETHKGHKEKPHHEAHDHKDKSSKPKTTSPPTSKGDKKDKTRVLAATTSPKSVGVKAMRSEAAAVKEESAEDSLAANFVGKRSAQAKLVETKLSHEADLQREGTASMVASAKALKDKVKTSLLVAEVLNQTAKTQYVAATSARVQALSSKKSAEAMMKTSNGIAMVESMAKNQISAAESAAKQSSLQMSKAKDMMARAQAMKKDAATDTAVVRTIVKNAGTESAAAKSLKAQATKEQATEKKMLGIETDMNSKSKEDMAHAKKILTVADRKEQDAAHANVEIAHAEKLLAKAQAIEAEALKNFSKAKAMNLTAHAEKSAAEAVMKQLSKQRKTANTMMAMAKKLKGASPIQHLAMQQLKAAELAEKRAHENIAGSKGLAAKSAVTQHISETRLEKAKHVEREARKQKAVAEGVKHNIDSESAVQESQLGEISAMRGAASQDISAGKAGQTIVGQEKTTVDVVNKAEKSMELAMKHSQDAVGGGTDNSKKALATVIKENERAAEAMKQPVEQAHKIIGSAALNVKMMEKGKGKMSEAHEKAGKMLTEISKLRVCVDLPGVGLKAAGKEQHFHREFSTGPIKSHKQCADLCHSHGDCKQVVYSPKNGCHLFSDSTADASDYQEAFKSSYCGARDEKEAMMKLLHDAYRRKPAQVVAK